MDWLGPGREAGKWAIFVDFLYIIYWVIVIYNLLWFVGCKRFSCLLQFTTYKLFLIFNIFRNNYCAGQAQRRLPRRPDVDPPGPVLPSLIREHLRREEAPKTKGLRATPDVIETMDNLDSQVPLGRLFEKKKYNLALSLKNFFSFWLMWTVGTFPDKKVFF